MEEVPVDAYYLIRKPKALGLRGKDKKHIGTTKKVRVFDKVRALENLGKHLGIFPTEKKEEGEGGDKNLDLTNLELSDKP